MREHGHVHSHSQNRSNRLRCLDPGWQGSTPDYAEFCQRSRSQCLGHSNHADDQITGAGAAIRKLEIPVITQALRTGQLPALGWSFSYGCLIGLRYREQPNVYLALVTRSRSQRHRCFRPFRLSDKGQAGEAVAPVRSKIGLVGGSLFVDGRMVTMVLVGASAVCSNCHRHPSRRFEQPNAVPLRPRPSPNRSAPSRNRPGRAPSASCSSHGLGHHRIGGIFYRNHIRFHHTHYAKGHLVSSIYRRNQGNNTPYFLIPTIVVAGGM